MIAIAEHFGWHGIREHTFEPHHLIGMQGPLREFMPIPDYLNDLNAMAEAERVLTPEQRKQYAELLLPMMGEPEWSYNDVFATATQRAEAFLRTLSKWTTP